MRRNVIATYEDEVLETRRRTIDVVRDLSSEVGFWHGGALVDVDSAWTSQAAAVDAAERACRRFGVTPASTLRVRVATVLTERHVVREPARFGSGDEAVPPRNVAMRHVWDSHLGSLSPREMEAEFRTTVAVGFGKGAHDPGDGLLALVRDVEVNFRPDSEAAFAGYGFRDPRLVLVTREDLSAKPDYMRAEVASGCLLHVTARCVVSVPEGAKSAACATVFQDVPVGVCLNRDFWHRSRDLHVWTDPDGRRSSWTVPAPIEAEAAE